MKKSLKYLKRFLLFVLSIIALYLLTALIFSFIGTRPVLHDCPGKERIYLLSNGIHLDLTLEIKDIDKHLLEKLGDIGKAKFLAFGWGDEDFYLNTPRWEDLTAKTFFKALFYKSSSVMHVTKYQNKGRNFISLEICPAQRAKLVQFISESFAVAKDEHFIKIENAGYSHSDFFYKGIGSYTCINTCNEWVNTGLKRTNVKTSLWSPFDQGILYHVQKNK